MTPPSPLSPDQLAAVRRVIDERRQLAGALLPVLHGIQDALGFVPDEAVPVVARELNLSRAEVHGVLTYYHHFRRTPPSGPVLQVCRAESCRTVGGEALLAQAKANAAGRGHCSVEPVYCLGLCAMSPAVMLDGRPHARMTPQKLDELMSTCAAGTAARMGADA